MQVAGVKIEVGGKKRLFRFSYLAMKSLAVDHGKERIEDIPSLMEGGLSFDFIEGIMYHGFKAGANYEKEEIDFDKEDMASWIDENVEIVATITKEVMEQFKASMSGPNGGKPSGGKKQPRK